ncbi:hypothetical protein BASA62_010267 [Batrachochytrium salamandrivorans]|nr:hypothetical protein BASA62_010267 [Batrachochytrium salamandrivorans]
MKFSTGIIISALAFNVFAETPTNISPGPLLDRRDAKPTMTDPLWKRNGEDDAEGSVPSPLRSDAEASGGRGRSGRGGDGSHSPSRFRQLSKSITLDSLVKKVYEKYKHLWTEDLRGRILAFGQKISVAAGNKAQMVGRFRYPKSCWRKWGLKHPRERKLKRRADLVSKLENILNKSRSYAKLHRDLLQATAETIAGGTKDIALVLRKVSDNAQEWAANIDTLVKTEFTKLLASMSKNPNSVSKAIETARGYVNNIQLYAKLSAANSNKIAIMIRDPTKAEQLGQKVEEVKDNGATADRRRGFKMRPSSP